MLATDPIKITGLAEFSRALRRVDRDLPKGLRLAGNDAAKIVVDWAQPRIPSRSGRARRSVRASSTRTEARVTGGGARVAYYPWLDFGGRVGRKKSVRRQFIKTGRAIYPGYQRNREAVHDALTRGLLRVVDDAGLAAD